MLESYAADSGQSKDRWNEKPQLISMREEGGCTNQHLPIMQID
jgi:hypothetical protein